MHERSAECVVGRFGFGGVRTQSGTCIAVVYLRRACSVPGAMSAGPFRVLLLFWGTSRTRAVQQPVFFADAETWHSVAANAAAFSLGFSCSMRFAAIVAVAL